MNTVIMEFILQWKDKHNYICVSNFSVATKSLKGIKLEFFPWVSLSVNLTQTEQLCIVLIVVNRHIWVYCFINISVFDCRMIRAMDEMWYIVYVSVCTTFSPKIWERLNSEMDLAPRVLGGDCRSNHVVRNNIIRKRKCELGEGGPGRQGGREGSWCSIN